MRASSSTCDIKILPPPPLSSVGELQKKAKDPGVRRKERMNYENISASRLSRTTIVVECTFHVV